MTVSALRKDRAESSTMLTALADAFRVGRRASAGGRCAAAGAWWTFRPMPSSAGGSGCPTRLSQAGDVAALGLGGTEHALLGAVVEMAESGGVVLTGRLAVSRRSRGWPITPSVVWCCSPGRVSSSWRSERATRSDCGVVEELMLHAPLVLPADGRVRPGRRRCRRRNGCPRGVGVLPHRNRRAAWTLHAEGELAIAVVATRRRPVGVATGGSPRDRRHRRLRARSPPAATATGPAFRGLTAMWRRGDEVFAEVALPAGRDRPTVSGCTRCSSTARCTRWC